MNARSQTRLEKELSIIASWCKGFLIKEILYEFKISLTYLYSILDKHGVKAGKKGALSKLKQFDLFK